MWGFSRGGRGKGGDGVELVVVLVVLVAILEYLPELWRILRTESVLALCVGVGGRH